MTAKIKKAKIFGRYYCLGSFPPLSTSVTTSAGNAFGKSSYANVTGKPSGKKLNIHTLFTPGEGSMKGLDAMIENGPWFIRNHPLILKKCHSDENLLKEDVSTIPVWVKLHGVPVTAFSEDGLTRSSYARVMIELRAGVKLKDNIVVAMPKLLGRAIIYNTSVGVKKTLKKPIQTSRGVSVGPKMGFKPQKECRHVPKKSTASSSGNKKKGSNAGTTNLVNNEATSSGSFFMNVDNSSTITTPIIDKIGKFKELLTSGKATLVDEADNPLKKVEFPDDYDSEDEVASVDNDMTHSMASERVGFGTQSLLKQWRDSYGNGDYDEDLYDDDMYEGQDLTQELQAICDNLDIRVRSHKKKQIYIQQQESLVTNGATLEANLSTNGIALDVSLATKGIELDVSLVAKQSTVDSTTSSEQQNESNGSRNECSRSGNENIRYDNKSSISRDNATDAEKTLFYTIASDIEYADIEPSYDSDTVSEVHHDTFENVFDHGI
nr:hypothetical protein [Tanacetum cinerariifolium]